MQFLRFEVTDIVTDQLNKDKTIDDYVKFKIIIFSCSRMTETVTRLHYIIDKVISELLCPTIWRKTFKKSSIEGGRESGRGG